MKTLKQLHKEHAKALDRAFAKKYPLGKFVLQRHTVPDLWGMHQKHGEPPYKPEHIEYVASYEPHRTDKHNYGLAVRWSAQDGFSQPGYVRQTCGVQQKVQVTTYTSLYLLTQGAIARKFPLILSDEFVRRWGQANN